MRLWLLVVNLAAFLGFVDAGDENLNRVYMRDRRDVGSVRDAKSSNGALQTEPSTAFIKNSVSSPASQSAPPRIAQSSSPYKSHDPAGTEPRSPDQSNNGTKVSTNGGNGRGDEDDGNTDCDCTVNAVAGLVWWFPETMYDIIARVVTTFDGDEDLYSLTYYPTSTINIADAIDSLDITYTSIENEYTTGYIMTTLPPPVAHSTAVSTVYQIAPNASGNSFFDAEQRQSILTLPPDPTYTISAFAEGLTATPSDPVLYITEVEIIQYDSIVNEQGSRNSSCPRPQTSTMSVAPQRVSFPDDLTDQLTYWPTPSAKLNTRAMQNFQLPSGFASCVPGYWRAPEPTMVVIVDITYEQRFQINIVHVEQTDTGTLDGPGPTDIPKTNVVTSPPVPTSTQSPILIIGSSTISPNNAEPSFVIGGSTLDARNPITVDGTTFSLPSGPTPSQIIINNTPSQLSQTTRPPTITVASTTATQIPNGAVVIGSATLLPGSVLTIANTVLSLAANPTAITINGQPILLTPSVLPLLTINSIIYPATSVPGYVISGNTLLPGGTIILADGNTLALPATPTALIVNGNTQYLPGYAPLTIGSVTLTGQAGAYIGGGITVMPGSTGVVDGTTFTVLPGGTQAVVNGKMSNIGGPASNIALPTTTVTAGMLATGSTARPSTTGRSGAGKGSAGYGRMAIIALVLSVSMSISFFC
ncbi:hypothetical protein BT63DRAFT_438839 [Microthyrium microscopicum]|uniref:Uncharacterized protein n=1 Tax=Microthyrium microscopicum TaxID=703497 RepID=A0A6A6UIM3_9PEZI|nr:hypothetical protein BT63DRAFT_438839 [Microthyrium microscopicum]